jgi:hypothetical protein
MSIATTALIVAILVRDMHEQLSILESFFPSVSGQRSGHLAAQH